MSAAALANDPYLELPLDGLRLIEASAGTGKTFTLATLFTRLVVERHLRMGQILAVTFTEAATQELRRRIRERLDLAARLAPQGILLLQKPTTPPLLLQSMQLLCGTRERLRRMEEKTATIEERMAEIRLVNRAKWALIDKQGMTEQEAHRYIEKQAMDRCVTRRSAAR